MRNCRLRYTTTCYTRMWENAVGKLPINWHFSTTLISILHQVLHLLMVKKRLGDFRWISKMHSITGRATRHSLNTPRWHLTLLPWTEYFPTRSRCSFTYRLSSKHRCISIRKIFRIFFKKEKSVKHLKP